MQSGNDPSAHGSPGWGGVAVVGPGGATVAPGAGSVVGGDVVVVVGRVVVVVSAVVVVASSSSDDVEQATAISNAVPMSAEATAVESRGARLVSIAATVAQPKLDLRKFVSGSHRRVHRRTSRHPGSVRTDG
jgi:hypothetical protein